VVTVTGVPSPAKKRAILDAATAAFLRSGYTASVDDIAAAAGVGKQTVYRHFGDKQALFLAALAAAREAGSDGPTVTVSDTGDPAADLTRMGEQILTAALSPTVAALHRLTIAEITNHPELSRHWGDGAAPYVAEELTGYLRRCDAAGLLSVPDPARAARQFAFLLITEGRTAGAYGTNALTARQRHTIAAETADLIVRAHRR
jgi:TetR/AcrR family transcriptional repressor of mexJK operon